MTDLNELYASVQTGEPELLSTEASDEHTCWGVNILMAPQAWEQARGKDIKVAVLDTGIDKDHPDLIDNIKGGINFTTDDQNDWDDRNGHGTHCAGVIAAVDNEQGIIGVAPMADLYAVKVLSDSGSGTLEWIVQGIDWCIENQIDIISMSLGTSARPPHTFQAAFQRAREAGIPIIAASGNDNAHIGWPGAYSHTISVAAIDSKLERAGFSNFGRETDLAAPGVDIYSTYLDNTYAKLSGTSMATPMVAGALALFMAQAKKQGLTFTRSELRTKLHEACVQLEREGVHDHFGHGLINIARLLG